MSFGGTAVPISQMNDRGPHTMAGFPYSSYGQAYPPSGASVFSPYPVKNYLKTILCWRKNKRDKGDAQKYTAYRIQATLY